MKEKLRVLGCFVSEYELRHMEALGYSANAVDQLLARLDRCLVGAPDWEVYRREVHTACIIDDTRRLAEDGTPTLIDDLVRDLNCIVLDDDREWAMAEAAKAKARALEVSRYRHGCTSRDVESWEISYHYVV